MPKLKKSSKRKKATIVFIYGAPAAGKYTTAKKLARITGYRVLHNHAVIDLAFTCFEFDRKNLSGQEIYEDLYFKLTEKVIKEGRRIIYTHSHSKNRIYPTGLTGPKFVEKIARIVKKNGGNFYPVHLVCEKNELMRRVVLPPRRRFNKSHSKRELEALMRVRNYSSPLHMKRNFAINNTRISAKRTAKIIKDHFNL